MGEGTWGTVTSRLSARDDRKKSAEKPAKESTQVPTEAKWHEVADDAIKWMGNAEKALLLRLCEARGQRVPLSEIAAAYGLPPTPSLKHDFPALTAYCAERREGAADGYVLPVESSGDDGSGWYWVEPDAALFLGAAIRRTI